MGFTASLQITEAETTEEALRRRFELPQPQRLRSDQESYPVAALQAELFHTSGLPSTKLSHYLKPDALTYLPEDTFNLSTTTYLGISGVNLAKPKANLSCQSTSTTSWSQLKEASKFKHKFKDLFRSH